MAGNAPAASDVLADDFEDGVMAAFWTEGTLLFPRDTGVTVVESGGVLTITPLAAAGGFHFNGYKTISSYDLSEGTAAVEITAASGSNAETLFVAYVDSSNYIEFSIFDTDLLIRFRRADVNSNTHITYDPVNHKWMRFSIVGTDALMQTSPDGSVWTTRKTSALAGLSPTFQLALEAGTEGVDTPGAAVFDNFVTTVPL
jgi:hypothetical protein